jgi:hypothetical protein
MKWRRGKRKGIEDEHEHEHEQEQEQEGEDERDVYIGICM